MKVPIKCSDCGKITQIGRDTWERYYQDDEDSFICLSCQIDIMDGYLPLEKKADKYGLTGEQQDNSMGIF